MIKLKCLLRNFSAMPLKSVPIDIPGIQWQLFFEYGDLGIPPAIVFLATFLVGTVGESAQKQEIQKAVPSKP